MKISEIDRQITEAEERLKSLFTALEQIRKDVKAPVLKFSAKWIEADLEHQLITVNPEKTKTFGSKGIAALKDEYKELQTCLPEIVDAGLGDNSRWPHAPEFPYKNFGSQRSYSTPEFLSGILRTIVSNLGPILKKYDVLNPGGGGGWSTSESASWYSSDLSMPPEIVLYLQDYDKNFLEYCREKDRLDDLKQKKIQEEARALWEKG